MNIRLMLITVLIGSAALAVLVGGAAGSQPGLGTFAAAAWSAAGVAAALSAAISYIVFDLLIVRRVRQLARETRHAGEAARVVLPLARYLHDELSEIARYINAQHDLIADARQQLTRVTNTIQATAAPCPGSLRVSFSLTMDGTVEFGTDAGLLWSEPREDGLHRAPITDLIYPPDVVELAGCVLAVLTGIRTTVELDVRVRMLDDKYRMLRLEGHLLLDEHGEFAGLHGQFHDHDPAPLEQPRGTLFDAQTLTQSGRLPLALRPWAHAESNA